MCCIVTLALICVYIGPGAHLLCPALFLLALFLLHYKIAVGAFGGCVFIRRSWAGRPRPRNLLAPPLTNLLLQHHHHHEGDDGGDGWHVDILMRPSSKLS